MEEKTILGRLQALLGLNKVELAQMKLMDGVTIIESENFEIGSEVFIVTEDEQRIPLPVGEYSLEDDKILIVVQEGIIGEMKEKEEEKEMPEEMPSEEMPQTEEAELTEAETQALNPKKVIKSTIEETLFSKIEELKKENEELKLQLSTMSAQEQAPVMEMENEPATKPISYNPEKPQAQPQFTWGQSAGMSTFDKIISKLNK